MSLWDNYKQSPFSPQGGFDMLFGHNDPSKDANRYMDQIPGVADKYFNPFIKSGQQAGEKLQGQYDKMMDPTAFMDEIMGKYKMSKGAEYQRDQLGQGISATAAAGGIAGTPDHQRQFGEMSEGIMSQDMHQYLMDALGIHAGALSGEQDIYGKGFNASGSAADMIGGNLASQGTMAYQQANQKNMDRNAMRNALMKALAQGAGAGG